MKKFNENIVASWRVSLSMAVICFVISIIFTYKGNYQIAPIFTAIAIVYGFLASSVKNIDNVLVGLNERIEEIEKEKKYD